MNEKSSCPVLRGRDDGNVILLLDQKGASLQAPGDEGSTAKDVLGFTFEYIRCSR